MKTPRTQPAEQRQLLKKLGVSPDAVRQPGELITKANTQKVTRTKVSIMGMV